MKKQAGSLKIFEHSNSKIKTIKQKKQMSIQQPPSTKNLNVLTVQVKNCGKREGVFIKFQYNKPLKQVKASILNKLSQCNIKIQRVIGFASANQDFAFDYKFQIQVGNLQKSIVLNCLYHQNNIGLDKYKICCCLAIGGFSKVFLVRSKTNGKFLAAKFIDKKKQENLSNSLLKNQRQISLKLNYPFLVKTHEFIQTEQFYVFIMDYCPGGQLFYLLKQIKCMSQDEARVFFIQILLGIQYIHNCGYMYRDLKPQNILLDTQGFIKIADFGLSKPYSQKSYSFCGSVQYMAPQIIRGKGHEKNVDYYCLGALLYQMLVGHPPFYDSHCTTQQTKNKILYNQVQFPRFGISQSAKDFIRKLTQKCQKQRLGYFGGCKQIMTHPWIGRINRKIFEQRQFQSPFPVSLDQLNFDSQQIGQSQRMFEQRINQSLSKNKGNSSKKRDKFTIKKHKSVSQKAENKYIKYQSPYRNKSLLNLMIKKRQRSPYQKVLRNSNSFKKLKLEINEQIYDNFATRNQQNLRLTTDYHYGGANKLARLNGQNKLKKKGKYVPFHTTVQKSTSPYKGIIFREKTNQNATEIIQKRQNIHKSTK